MATCDAKSVVTGSVWKAPTRRRIGRPARELSTRKDRRLFAAADEGGPERDLVGYGRSPPRAVWRLFDLFRRYELPITVHAAAVAIERNPEVGAAIAEYGFEPCAHGYRWEEAWTLEPWFARREDVARAWLEQFREPA